MCSKFIYLAFCRLLQRQTARIVIQNWGETWAESQLSAPAAASPRVENDGTGSEKLARPGRPNGQIQRRQKRTQSDTRARIHAAAFSIQAQQTHRAATAATASDDIDSNDGEHEEDSAIQGWQAASTPDGASSFRASAGRAQRGRRRARRVWRRYGERRSHRLQPTSGGWPGSWRRA